MGAVTGSAGSGQAQGGRWGVRCVVQVSALGTGPFIP